MKPCSTHWAMMREAIEQYGLWPLVAKSGEAAMENAIADIQQEPDPNHERFDPLMSLHWHFMNNALRCGGFYLMGQTPDGANDGHYCPLCEAEKHQPGFVAKPGIDNVVQQIAAWCREQGLIGQVT
jgi:hypothetical protein